MHKLSRELSVSIFRARVEKAVSGFFAWQQNGTGTKACVSVQGREGLHLASQGFAPHHDRGSKEASKTKVETSVNGGGARD